MAKSRALLITAVSVVGVMLAIQAATQPSPALDATRPATVTEARACSDPSIVAQLPEVMHRGYRAQNRPNVEVFEVSGVGPDRASMFLADLSSRVQDDPIVAEAMRKAGLGNIKCRANVFTSAGNLVVIFEVKLVNGREYISWEIDPSGTR